MNEIMPFILFAIGLVLIIQGSNWFVDGAIFIAKKLKVSDVLIGATIVSICTTLPEFMVSVTSSLRGQSEMALGNALGSIVCNTALVLGIAFIFAPSYKQMKKISRSSILFLFLMIGIFIIATSGAIGKLVGFSLLVILMVYMYDHIREAEKDEEIEHFDIDTGKMATIKNILLFILGLGFVVYGSNLLVENGVEIAKSLGVPDIIIGITMTAIGTSLPELVTCIAALRKGAVGVTIGNIIGADILNILTVIGASATINPLIVRPQMVGFYIPYIVVLAALIVFLTFVKKDKLIKISGFIFVLSYLITTTISVLTIK
jgi:cation:H+ antiporter